MNFSYHQILGIIFGLTLIFSISAYPIFAENYVIGTYGSFGSDLGQYSVKQGEEIEIRISGSGPMPPGTNYERVYLTITLPDGTQDGHRLFSNADGYFELFLPIKYDSQMGTYSVFATFAGQILGTIDFEVERKAITNYGIIPGSTSSIENKLSSGIIPSQNYITLHGSEFSINYPDNWKLETGSYTDNVTNETFKKIEFFDNDSSSNYNIINFSLQPLPQDARLVEFMPSEMRFDLFQDIVNEQMQDNSISNFKQVSKYNKEINGIDFFIFEYDVTYKNFGNLGPTKITEIFSNGITSNGKIFFSYAEILPDDKYLVKPVVEKMLNSIRLTSSPVPAPPVPAPPVQEESDPTGGIVALVVIFLIILVIIKKKTGNKSKMIIERQEYSPKKQIKKEVTPKEKKEIDDELKELRERLDRQKPTLPKPEVNPITEILSLSMKINKIHVDFKKEFDDNEVLTYSEVKESEELFIELTELKKVSSSLTREQIQNLSTRTQNELIQNTNILLEKCENSLLKIKIIKTKRKTKKLLEKKSKEKNTEDEIPQKYMARDFLKGDYFYSIKNYEKALFYYNKELDNAPAYDVISKKAHTLFHLNRFPEAIACFDRNLKKYHDRPEFWRDDEGKGDAYFAMGDFEEAKKCYNIAMEKAPGYGEIRLEKKLNNIKIATEEILKKKEPKTKNQKAWRMVEQARSYGLDNLKETLECYERAKEYRPDYYLIYRDKARLFHFVGLFNFAIQYYKKSLDVEPTHNEYDNRVYGLELAEKNLRVGKTKHGLSTAVVYPWDEQHQKKYGVYPTEQFLEIKKRELLQLLSQESTAAPGEFSDKSENDKKSQAELDEEWFKSQNQGESVTYPNAKRTRNREELHHKVGGAGSKEKSTTNKTKKSNYSLSPELKKEISQLKLSYDERRFFPYLEKYQPLDSNSIINHFSKHMMVSIVDWEKKGIIKFVKGKWVFSDYSF